MPGRGGAGGVRGRAAMAAAVVLAFCGVWAGVGELRGIEKKGLSVERATRAWAGLEERYAAMRRRLDGSRVVGYFPVYGSDDLAGLDRHTRAYCLLAPIPIDFGREHEVAIADFFDDRQPGATGEEKLGRFLALGKWRIKERVGPGLAIVERAEVSP